MELTAAIKALEALTRPCEVDFYTDSQYLRQGITEWIKNWRKNGWKTSAKKPVLNQDLWMRLYELTQQHQIKWHWTRGHAGDKFNERVDQLATEARLKISQSTDGAELMSKMSDRVAGFGTTIFTEINMLAQQHNALNLGQGKPDFDGPADVIAAAVRALQVGRPQPVCARSRRAVASSRRLPTHASRFYNLDIDPNAGVVVTAGATEAIFSSVLGLVDKGDEVIVIEPYFDSYVPNITMAGATPVYVPLHPPDWTFDPDELRKAFNTKTRAIILNTPHNPTGRVFTLEELTLIADLCKEHDVTVISDEVYEHLIFDSARHIPMATLPGMFERTVTVSSLGKTFSVTGWKIGWVYGAPELVTGVARAHQFVTFAVNHPAQEAAAYALSLPGTYYEEFQAMYTAKRDLMMQRAQQRGLESAPARRHVFRHGGFRRRVRRRRHRLRPLPDLARSASPASRRPSSTAPGTRTWRARRRASPSANPTKCCARRASGWQIW